MDAIQVTQWQYDKLRELSAQCNHSNAVPPVFDEKNWLEGVRNILGYVPLEATREPFQIRILWPK